MSILITKSTFVISSPSYELCPVSENPEYVFIWRSNVGKSSLINAICSKKELARTSSKPGKTQLINYFDIESIDEEKNENLDNDANLENKGIVTIMKIALQAKKTFRRNDILWIYHDMDMQKLWGKNVQNGKQWLKIIFSKESI